MTKTRSDVEWPPRSAILGGAAFHRPRLWPAVEAFFGAVQPPRVIDDPDAWERDSSGTSGRGAAPGSLSRDPYVRLALALFALSSLPYIFSLLSPEAMLVYSFRYVHLPFLALLIATTTRSFRLGVDRDERRFWALWSVGVMFWTAPGLLSLVFTDVDSWDLDTILINSLPNLIAYAAIALALEHGPHLRPDRTSGRLQAFDRLGTFVFLLGLLLYFTVVPSVLDSDTYWASCLVLFVVLDAYIAFRLTGLRRQAVDLGWRATYSWLLCAALLLAMADSVYLLIWKWGILEDEVLFLLDVPSMLAFTAIIVATRANDYKSREGAPRLVPPGKPLGNGPLVVYVVAAPAMHLLLYRFGWSDPALRPTRELLVVLFSLFLGALAIAYQHLLRTENQRLAFEELRVQEELRQHAYYDRLTGLPSRTLFSEHLARALAHGQRSHGKFAVLYCDLDQFKRLNEALGHDGADQVLVTVAERLRGAVRGFNAAARWGDDEFTVLVEGVLGEPEAARSAARLLASLSAPMVVAGRIHVVTASIGVALYPQDGEDEETLLRHADTAMYQAKVEGGNAYKIFTPTMTAGS